MAPISRSGRLADEKGAKRLRDRLRLVGQLPIVESLNAIAGDRKAGVADPVVGECLAAGVGRVAVDLDDQALGAPEKVDGVFINGCVDLRWREPVTPAEAEEVAFELAAGAVRYVAGTEGEAVEFGLATGGAHELGFEDLWEVFERAAGRGDRDA